MFSDKDICTLVSSMLTQIELSSDTKYIPLSVISSTVSIVYIKFLDSELILPSLIKSINLFHHYIIVSPLLLKNSKNKDLPTS